MSRAIERIVALVAGKGGVARSATLVREGEPESMIRAAVDRGALIRLRRFWVAVPTADAALRDSARDGVVVTCATAASRLGLWTFGSDRRHVAVPAHAGRVKVDAVIHRAHPVVLRHPDRLVDEVENVLVLIAMCRPSEEALVVWESAIRKGLVQRDAMLRLPLLARAREIGERAVVTSDSGLETLVVPRLRWTRQRILAQVWIRGHAVDFLIGERLVLQIDGGTHVDDQRRSDVRHDAELALLGYHVIRVTYRDVIHDWPRVHDLIVRALAQGLHLA